MEKNSPNPGDPTTSKPSPAPRRDEGETTPPHGDEIVNQQRNMSRHQPPAADPDTDRPAE
jgi:hypothetical protein